MRHKKPEVLIEYEKRMQEPPPQVCHNCEHYQQNGTCEIHQSEPPEEFAATPSVCDDWSIECPF